MVSPKFDFWRRAGLWFRPMPPFCHNLSRLLHPISLEGQVTPCHPLLMRSLTLCDCMALLDLVPWVSQIFHMPFESLAFDQQIIYIDFHTSPDLVFEHVIDNPLVRSSGVFQLERHCLVGSNTNPGW